MDNRPIGVFDSGLGGLTTVKELAQILPYENIVYFGDTARLPYGGRSQDIIQKYAKQDINFLLSKNVKMIVAACGTVSSVASNVGEHLNVPFTGVLSPTAEAAAAATRTKRVGIIGTSATIRSGSYRRALAAIDPAIQVFEQDCPLFVPLVESGMIAEDEQITVLTVKKYLSALKDAGIDTLILGCTHYPILRRVIQNFMGPSVVLIDSGRETAFFCSQILEKQHLLNRQPSIGEYSFYVSDQIEGFYRIAEIFLGMDVKRDVSHVDIDLY
jgi:glutamate racemase